MLQAIKFAQENTTGKTHNVHISEDDRRKHFYILGGTGTGKSTLMLSMIEQDLYYNKGVAIIDPHGELALDALRLIPESRKDDLIYIDPYDYNFPVAINVFGGVPEHRRGVEASNLLTVFKKIWADSWGARMEFWMYVLFLALFEIPKSTLLTAELLLENESTREKLLRQVTDPYVKRVFREKLAHVNKSRQEEYFQPILNKIGRYMAHPSLRYMLTQEKSQVNFRSIIDSGSIIIVNLSKGNLGETEANLLGSLIVTKLFQAALSRTNVPKESRKDFYLYIDEFHNFTTDEFASIMSEARKYRLNLILAHQYLHQIDVNTRQAILTNCGTQVAFRLDGQDADILENTLGSKNDLIDMDIGEMRYRTIHNGKIQKPCTGETIRGKTTPPYENVNVDAALKNARKKYARPKSEVVSSLKNHLKTDPVIEIT